MLKFGKIAKRYQKLPKSAKSGHIRPKLPKVAKGCQNLPEVDKSASEHIMEFLRISEIWTTSEARGHESGFVL